jgi:thioredoxin reductase (NADPH)
MATHTTRMLIIGSGPAGLSAAIYGARAGMEPIVVQGLQPGGQLTITTDVENYPGFRDVIQGPWLMQEMQAQAEHVGTRMLWDTITSVDLSGPPFRAIGDGGDIYEGETLVIATGAQAKWLGAPGEQELGGKGVSACATCDGFFYRGKKVVIGGGNTAVEEALYLTNHSPDVTVIHRRDSFRAEKILQDRLAANEKVSVAWNKAVRRFVGDPANGGLTGVEVEDTRTGEISVIPADGAFVAIGHAPATELFKGKLELDGGGYIIVEPGTPKTAIPAVTAWR